MLNKYLLHKWKHEEVKRKTFRIFFKNLFEGPQFSNKLHKLVNLQTLPSWSTWSKSALLTSNSKHLVYPSLPVHSLWPHSYQVFITFHLTYCKIFLCQSLPFPPKLYTIYILPKYHFLHSTSRYLLLRPSWKKFKLNWLVFKPVHTLARSHLWSFILLLPSFNP